MLQRQRPKERGDLRRTSNHSSSKPLLHPISRLRYLHLPLSFSFPSHSFPSSSSFSSSISTSSTHLPSHLPLLFLLLHFHTNPPPHALPLPLPLQSFPLSPFAPPYSSFAPQTTAKYMQEIIIN